MQGTLAAGERCETKLHPPHIDLTLKLFQFHDDEDAGQYCALSQVARWCFTFATYICHELGIVLVGGGHFPNRLEIVAEADQMELDKATDSRWDLQDTKSEKVIVTRVGVVLPLFRHDRFG